mmetsp:Transcript_5256/g.15219  ORF Transcript_5256/g.15219 Transcript_5256/m.15219 type:complete len:348 (-) Transcript_5256:1117-2160(-)
MPPNEQETVPIALAGNDDEKRHGYDRGKKNICTLVSSIDGNTGARKDGEREKASCIAFSNPGRQAPSRTERGCRVARRVGISRNTPLSNSNNNNTYTRTNPKKHAKDTLSRSALRHGNEMLPTRIARGREGGKTGCALRPCYLDPRCGGHRSVETSDTCYNETDCARSGREKHARTRTLPQHVPPAVHPPEKCVPEPSRRRRRRQTPTESARVTFAGGIKIERGAYLNLQDLSTHIPARRSAARQGSSRVLEKAPSAMDRPASERVEPRHTKTIVPGGRLGGRRKRPDDTPAPRRVLSRTSPPRRDEEKGKHVLQMQRARRGGVRRVAVKDAPLFLRAQGRPPPRAQ